MLDALIFDIDGTLLNSNPAHVEAWAEAFEEFGYRIAPDRIEPEIGKGGDRLVPDVLGAGAEARLGEALRKRQTEILLELVRRDPVEVIPGALDLLDATRARGLCAALATSSTRSHLDALLASARVDLCAHVDAVVTRGPDDASKPAPDLVVAAVDQVGLAPTQCAMVGDTRFDAIAASRAGVTCLAVCSGAKTAAELLGGGARGVWRDCADLLDHFDEALRRPPGGGSRPTSSRSSCVPRWRRPTTACAPARRRSGASLPTETTASSHARTTGSADRAIRPPMPRCELSGDSDSRAAATTGLCSSRRSSPA